MKYVNYIAILLLTLTLLSTTFISGAYADAPTAPVLTEDKSPSPDEEVSGQDDQDGDPDDAITGERNPPNTTPEAGFDVPDGIEYIDILFSSAKLAIFLF